MIKQDAINKIKFISGGLTVFFIAALLGFNPAIPAFLLALIAYFKYRNAALKKYNLLHLTLLFVIILAVGYFIIQQRWSKFYIPFCIIPMLATLLFNQLEITLLLTLAPAIVIASLAGNLYLGLLFFTSGIFCGILVLDTRRRITIIRAGLLTGIFQALLLLILDRFWLVPIKTHLASYLVLLLNGLVSSIVVLGVLPVFEYLFKTTTNISLLELADFNHPLLQRMIIEAPGTYHHSLIVGNLSEAACRAIKANALLARIGAYYHDIGKLSKSEYFSENQLIKESKHDTLSPTMSKLIIMNHVKEGVELARKYRLNDNIIDFIQQHHGSSLVYYFYRRALETLEEDHEIKEEGFRYSGPKPANKETAIVLLADSVEAATRALKDPHPAKITEVVHKMINNKFIDGQLDECDLTLKDLEKISEVFIRILSGIYHSRVSYPEEAKSEDSHKKFPKENPRQSDKDKKSNP